jgi:hypothetical protein
MSLEKLITISSDDKDSDSNSNSDFFVSLKEKFYTQQITRIMVKEVTVPNCFYNISNGTSNGKQNDILYFTDNKVDKHVFVEPGQYNNDQFMTTLTTQFFVNGTVVVITQDPILQTLIFTFVSPVVLLYNSPMSPVIGITQNLICIANTPHSANFPPDLSGVNAVNIHSTAIGEAHGIDANTGLISLVERVSLHDIPYGSFGYKQNNDSELATIYFEQPRNLNRIDIRLRDTQGSILNIGTKKMSIVLKVYFAT